ncbi:hypothetical protein QAD02_023936 [Eretmocerus hayati]|uniref:Uncharacterized protein n=1 Tax=Eretmocerus hayati TaxID=131215 RepID=A0ACC2PYX1_9HYME|nr:hypothetical protein QAD02_023936 [Eretmocerus hayati]
MIWLLCSVVLMPHAIIAGLVHSHQRNNNSDNNTELDLNINSQRSKEFSHPLPANVGCKRQAKCITMTNATCMGTRLPFSSTTLDLVPVPTTEGLIREKLHELQALKHIPKCWAVVQPFLCSIFMPKCVNDTVDLPSQEMCRMISGPCRVLFNHTIWPSFIKCEDTDMFPSLCEDDERGIKFNTTGECLLPLVPTNNSLAVFEGIEGCGYPCSDPLYTYNEKLQTQLLVLWTLVIWWFQDLVGLVTVKKIMNYAASVTSFFNSFVMISCSGRLLAFNFDLGDVNCREDVALGVSESSGESLFCRVVFVSVYYSTMAAIVWFVILTHRWYKSAQSFKKMPSSIKHYELFLPWCLPMIPTVAVMAMKETDGNYVRGICLARFNNPIVGVWFVLVPILLGIFIGGYFLRKGLTAPIYRRRNSQKFISEEAFATIQNNIRQTGLFLIISLISVIITFGCYIYDFIHSWEWKQSFEDFIMCSITSKYSSTSDCKMNFRPNIITIQLHLLGPLLPSIVMAPLLWTNSTLDQSDTQTKLSKRFSNSESERPVYLKKHQVTP